MDGHVDGSLFELELGTLPAEERGTVESHLTSCDHCRRERDATRELLAALPHAMAAAPPPQSLRVELLARAAVTPQPSRFLRFAETAARLLQVTVDKARALLEEMTRPEVWVPGFTPEISLFHVQAGGPDAASLVAGFVTVKRGGTFPPHRHFGREWGFIVQGEMHDDDGAVYRPGDTSEKAAGSEHEFRAGEDEDLVYLVVLEEGVDVGGVVIRAQDPRL